MVVYGSPEVDVRVMPKARTRRGRVHQVANWLRDKHPCPMPVDIKFRKASSLAKRDKLFGWAERGGRRGRIVLVESSSITTSILLDTLLHEWAHLQVWGSDRFEAKAGFTSAGRARPRSSFAHDAIWGVAYSALIESFHDCDPPGSITSRDYSEEKF
jgi:hypothetical protein